MIIGVLKKFQLTLYPVIFWPYQKNLISSKMILLDEYKKPSDIHRPSAEHIPNVLKQLQDKIVQFMETWPRDPMAKNYRMLAMTAAGMVKSPGQMM